VDVAYFGHRIIFDAKIVKLCWRMNLVGKSSTDIEYGAFKENKDTRMDCCGDKIVTFIYAGKHAVSEKNT
jgi:hypothetical protein